MNNALNNLRSAQSAVEELLKNPDSITDNEKAILQICRSSLSVEHELATALKKLQERLARLERK